MKNSQTFYSNIGYFVGMMFPTLVLFGIFSYVITDTAFLSLFDWDGLSPKSFVGLKNYLRLVSDYRFLRSLWNIAVLIMTTLVFQVGIGIALAFFLTDLRFSFASFFKSIIFMPVVISNVAVSLYFLTLYDYQNGTLNTLLKAMGFDRINFLGLGLKTIYFAIIPQTWQYIGLMFIIAYTAFTTVSQDQLDAARIDGLNSWQRLVHMFIPISWSSLSVCFVIALVGPLKSFEHIWIVTTGGGSDQMSHIPGTLMFNLGFSNYEYGYGSAAALVILVLAIFLVALFRISNRKRDFS